MAVLIIASPAEIMKWYDHIRGKVANWVAENGEQTAPIPSRYVSTEQSRKEEPLVLGYIP